VARVRKTGIPPPLLSPAHHGDAPWSARPPLAPLLQKTGWRTSTRDPWATLLTPG